ncbi:hypothetical protein BJX68DRAFT_223923 [Aspergillus pseudodeflectus]|uniref:Uncharacterized protein n=1 Tax=Aspergillus pseudodeflectus TaxID=176178 RepID=A0ABR4LC39_9EURO
MLSPNQLVSISVLHDQLLHLPRILNASFWATVGAVLIYIYRLPRMAVRQFIGRSHGLFPRSRLGITRESLTLLLRKACTCHCDSGIRSNEAGCDAAATAAATPTS